jgi:hypothetical protein
LNKDGALALLDMTNSFSELAHERDAGGKPRALFPL